MHVGLATYLTIPPVRLREADPEPCLDFGLKLTSHVIDQNSNG